MSKQIISTGTLPNDGTGDTLINGANKINNNFNEIYSTFGDGTNLSPTVGPVGPQGPIGLLGPQGPSGSSSGIATSRVVVTGTTSSIGAGTTTNLNISGYKTYGLLKVGISSAAWVVLYTDASSRTSDASRNYLTDPIPGSGVIAEVRTTTSGISTFIMSPGIIGWNDDVSVGSTIYARVTNNESSNSAITVNLTVLKLEE